LARTGLAAVFGRFAAVSLAAVFGVLAAAGLAALFGVLAAAGSAAVCGVLAAAGSGSAAGEADADVVASAGLPGVARLLLRRCGRVLGRDPITPGWRFSLIALIIASERAQRPAAACRRSSRC
jgi:hypothetical protein